MLNAFLAGLISIVTPVTFFMTYFLLIAFSQVNLAKKPKLKFILIFCSLVLILYPIYGILILNLPYGYNLEFRSNQIFNYINFILSFVFGLWLAGILKNVINENTKGGRIILILFFAVTFTLISFNGTGPIIGGIVIESSIYDIEMIFDFIYYLEKFSTIGLFAFGLLIPVSLILIFMQKPIRKLNEKNGWEYVQFFSGIVFIALVIIGQVIK